MLHHLSKLLICTSLLLSSFTFAATITDPAKTLSVGQEESLFTITLASNPSTGFVWLLESYDSTLLKLVKHDYVAPDNKKNRVGTTGVENWTFTEKSKIPGPQVTKITLINARPWDINNTTHEKTAFTVVLY